jgi:hypothetical protein
MVIKSVTLAFCLVSELAGAQLQFTRVFSHVAWASAMLDLSKELKDDMGGLGQGESPG